MTQHSTSNLAVSAQSKWRRRPTSSSKLEYIRPDSATLRRRRYVSDSIGSRLISASNTCDTSVSGGRGRKAKMAKVPQSQPQQKIKSRNKIKNYPDRLPLDANSSREFRENSRTGRGEARHGLAKVCEKGQRANVGSPRAPILADESGRRLGDGEGEQTKISRPKKKTRELDEMPTLLHRNAKPY